MLIIKRVQGGHLVFDTLERKVVSKVFQRRSDADKRRKVLTHMTHAAAAKEARRYG